MELYTKVPYRRVWSMEEQVSCPIVLYIVLYMMVHMSHCVVHDGTHFPTVLYMMVHMSHCVVHDGTHFPTVLYMMVHMSPLCCT